MTRFARAKGSKAANERLPEQSTPWSVMKNQLQQTQKEGKDAAERAKFEAMRKENYEKFLKEQKESKIKETWCEFDVDSSTSKKRKKSENVESESSTENIKSGKKIKNKKSKVDAPKKNYASIINQNVDEDDEDNATDSKSDDGRDDRDENEINSDSENEDGEDIFVAGDNENQDDVNSSDEKEISQWLDEYSDKEMDDKYTDITSQLDVILRNFNKSEKKKDGKNKDKENENELKNNNKESFTETGNKRKKKKMKNVETKSCVENSKGKDVEKKKKMENGEIDPCVENGEGQDAGKKKKNKKVKNDEINPCVENREGQDAGKKKKNKKVKNDEINPCIENVEGKDGEKKKKNKKRKRNPELEVNDDKNEDVPQHVSKSKRLKNANNETPITNETQNQNKKEKNKKKKQKVAAESTTENGQGSESNKNKKDKLPNSNNIQKKNDKHKDKEYKRRKPLNTNTSIIIVNGEELEVTNLDGFPVLSQDAERLRELRKNLVSKGIPRSEVDRTMKLERRKAEKALTRIRKKLCFHCRKGGHNLSECPELNKKTENTGVPSSGICFKCGSTEHTHFACKVVRGQEYKFAQCYICKEQGHISRQCPDNPKGIYPKGGACRECGDTTHLKKDCPKIIKGKEENTIKLDIMDHNNIEGDVKKSNSASSKTTNVKLIKF